MKRIFAIVSTLALALMALPSLAEWTYEKDADVTLAAGDEITLPSGAELGNVTLAAGSKINLPSDGSTIYFISLNGEGEVATAAPGGAYSAQALQIGKPWSVPDVKVSNFSGTISGNIVIFANWTLNLLNAANPFSLANDNFICYHPPCGAEADSKTDYPGVRGVLGVMKFGNKREAVASSISTADGIKLSGGGTIKYLGTGETTSHDIVLSYGGTIDGGATGGLEFAAKGGNTPEWYHDADGYFTRLTLTGDNTTPCSMSGTIRGSLTTSSACSLYVTKEGTGTWYLKDGGSRDRMRGPLAVREGTLQFDSLANAGAVCSLGCSDLLYDAPAQETVVKAEYAVDYAFLLGGGVNPIFEYVGAGVSASDRKIEVTGAKATISQAGTGALNLTGGVKAQAGQTTALHLKRAADTGAAMIRELSDGAGKLSVVKEGAGDWTLGGNLTFSGLFEVKEGKAIVKPPATTQPYTWFRLILQGAAKADGDGVQQPDTTIWLRAIGLFDADGERICKNLEEVRPSTYDDVPATGGGWVANDKFSYANLQPGQFSLGGASGSTLGIEYYKEYPVTQLFNLNNTWTAVRLQTSPALGQGAELSIVFRPPEGKVAKYYDVMNSADWYATGSSHVTKWTLEGSVDGTNWVKLHQVTEDPKRDGMRWSSTGQHPGYANDFSDLVDANCITKGFGYEIVGETTAEEDFDQLQNASVKVDAGATLAGAQDIKDITIDANGNGTFEGVTFAKDGTINLVNLTTEAKTVSLTFSNVDADSLDNLKSWDVAVDGHPPHGTLSIDAAAGTVTVPATWTYEKGADIHVWSGETITLPSDADVGNVVIDAGGVLNLPSDGSTIYMSSLNGAGLLATTAKAGQMWSAQSLYVGKSWSVPDVKVSTFSGKIEGNIRLVAGWTLNLTGSESLFSLVNDNALCLDPPCAADADSRTDYPGVRGVLGVMKFGNKRATAAASISTADAIRLVGGGMMRYLGTGESTTRDISPAFSGTIDAGATGGLHFLSPSEWYIDSSTAFSRLTLTGDGLTPNSTDGRIRWNPSDNGKSCYMIKEGLGTWYIKDPVLADGRDKMRGPFAVREGTLQYDSLAAKGVTSSLGKSDQLYDAPAGLDTVDEQYAVDYAFLLGGGLNPIFEYVGAGESKATDRLIELTGTKATLSYGAAATGKIDLAGGVKAFDAGVKELHLAAGAHATTGRAVVGPIADGAGQVCIVKEGAGTWTLGGVQTFTGGVKVDEGKLVVAGSQLPRAYRWYRFTVLGSGYTESLSPVSQVMIKRLGLYDASGKEIGLDFTEVKASNYDEAVGALPSGTTTVNFTADKFNWRNLQPGQCTFGEFKGELHYSLNDPLANLFSLAPQCFNCSMDGSVEPTASGYSVPIVFRLPDDVDSVASYDVLPHTDYTTTHTYAFKLEGSVDGMVWDELHEVTTDAKRLEAQWYSTGVTSPRPTYNHAAQNCVDDKFGFAVAEKDVGALLNVAETQEKLVPFTWYRLLVTGVKTANDAGWSYNVFIRRLGLFDAQGNAVGLGITNLLPDNYDEITGSSLYIKSSHFNWQNLKPGECTVGEIPYCAASAGWGDSRVQAMEFQKYNTPAEMFNLDDNWFRTELVPAIGSEAGFYLPIVFRPPAGSNPIAYYDLLPFTDWDSNDHVESFRLEASIDGEHWVKLHEVTECPQRKENEWYSTGVKNVRVEGNTHEDQNCVEKGFGYAIATGVSKTELVSSTQFANASSVEVANGATLAADGLVAPLKAITVDAAGAGTIENFPLAANGTIRLSNYAGGDVNVTLPTLSGCTGDFTGWTVTGLPANTIGEISGGVLSVQHLVGLAPEDPLTAIEAYNNAITGAYKAYYLGEDVWLTVADTSFDEGTDYSLANQYVGTQPASLTQPKLHLTFRNCAFPGGSQGTMSPDKGPGSAVTDSNRKEIALCSVKELLVDTCSFADYSGDSYVIDVNAFNWFENEGCGITITNCTFAAAAGSRTPISIKNKIAHPPAFVEIVGNTFTSAGGVANVICFGDQAKSTDTFGGANFPIIIRDNTFVTGSDSVEVSTYKVMTGAYQASGKDTQYVPIAKSFTHAYDAALATWVDVPKFDSGSVVVVQEGDLTAAIKDGACSVTGAGELTADVLAGQAVTNLTIGAGVTGVGASAFADSRDLRTVTIGADCTAISAQAFKGCPNLNAITIAGNVTVGDYAFYRCNSLESITFTQTPANLPDNAFNLQTAIYMKDGLPTLYTIPTVTIAGYTQKLMGTNDLNGEWTEITTEQQKAEYHFFKIDLAPVAP